MNVPTYHLDDTRSLLYVLVENDAGKLLSGLGHNHVIRATRWSGTLDFDPDAPKATRVAIDVPVDGLAVDEEHMNKKVGYKGGVRDQDRKKTRDNMLKKEQLYADRFPTITFRSTTIEAPDPDTLDVQGELTVRGKTKAVRLPMHLRRLDDGLRIEGRLITTHADFGFKPYTAPLGTLRNNDEITFVVEVFIPLTAS